MLEQEEKAIGKIRFPMALRVAAVFRVTAFVSLVLTVLATVAGGIALAKQTDTFGNHLHSSVAVVAYILGGLFGGAVIASFFAFFGYVLEILVEIFSEMWELRITVESDEDD
jgi:amino acid transporter